MLLGLNIDIILTGLDLSLSFGEDSAARLLGNMTTLSTNRLLWQKSNRFILLCLPLLRKLRLLFLQFIKMKASSESRPFPLVLEFNRCFKLTSTGNLSDLSELPSCSRQPSPFIVPECLVCVAFTCSLSIFDFVTYFLKEDLVATSQLLFKDFNSRSL
jgi:hypothetical protein